MGFIFRLIPRGLVAALLVSAMMLSTVASAGAATPNANQTGVWEWTIQQVSHSASTVKALAIVTNSAGLLSGNAFTARFCQYSITGTLDPSDGDVSITWTPLSSNTCTAVTWTFTGVYDLKTGTTASGTYHTNVEGVKGNWSGQSLI